MCYVEEQNGGPLFKVKVVEKGYDDLVLTGPSPKGVTSDPRADRKWTVGPESTDRLVCVQLCGSRSWSQWPR